MDDKLELEPWEGVRLPGFSRIEEPLLRLGMVWVGSVLERTYSTYGVYTRELFGIVSYHIV